MQDRYTLSRSRRLTVRAIALLFFVLGAMRVAQLPLPLVQPRLIAPSWAGGGLIGDPEALLPEEARFRLAADPGARTRFHARLEEPGVRIAHLLLGVGAGLPAIVILGGMGMALWRSTRLVPRAVESGLPWLMAVGWGCVAVALVFPLLDGFRTGLLLRGVIPTPVFWYDPDTWGTTYVLLLIAAGILAATWTIAAGLRARADMAEIV